MSCLEVIYWLQHALTALFICTFPFFVAIQGFLPSFLLHLVHLQFLLMHVSCLSHKRELEKLNLDEGTSESGVVCETTADVSE